MSIGINANYVVQEIEEISESNARYWFKRTKPGNIELVVMNIVKQTALKVGSEVALDMEIKVAIPMPVLAEIKDVGNTGN